MEVAPVVRRLAARGDITGERGREMLAILEALPIRRHAHPALLGRVWAMRADVAANDAVGHLARIELVQAASRKCRDATGMRVERSGSSRSGRRVARHPTRLGRRSMTVLPSRP